MESEPCVGQKKVINKKREKSNKSRISTPLDKMKKLPVFEDHKQISSNKAKKQTTFEEIEQKIFDNCSLEKLKRTRRSNSKNTQLNTANESNIKLKRSLLPHKPKKIDEIKVNNLKNLKTESNSLISTKMASSNIKVINPKKKVPFKIDKSGNDSSLSVNCERNKMNRSSKPTSERPITSSKGDSKTKRKKKNGHSNVDFANKGGIAKHKKNTPKKVKANQMKKYESSSESGASDWENVDELYELLNQKESLPKNENILIELKQENLLWGYKKRKRRTEQDLIEDYLRKQVNKSIREVYENMHKCHLLCLFAHGKHVNEVISSQNLLATSMSLIPKTYFTPKRFDLSHLEKFVKWFCKLIDLKQNNMDSDSSNCSLEEILSKRLSTKSVNSKKELVLLFVLISRSIGMDVRLVFSFYPISWRPSIDCLIRPKKVESDDINVLEEEKPSTSFESSNANINDNKKKISRKMISSESDDEIVPSNRDKRKKHIKSIKKDENSDSEFELNEKNINRAKKVSKSNCKNATKRKSSDDVDQVKKVKREVLGEWVEVYVEEEEKWISVDITKSIIHCASDIEARSPSNTAYIVAYHVDHTVKDVTKRYVSSWLSQKDKIRCDGIWWDAALKPFLRSKTRQDKEEDKELEENLKMQPLPKTVAEYKNHPLYALQRHLLKFEAIYPPNPSPIGFFRGEAVYPRECIKIVSGREYWIREAKVVRVGEEPYKVVKARPKWDKGLCQVLKDRPLELFGEWQVEDYEPPIAKNGKVPRNEYGNVELFKPSMLPKGCVHLPIAGLARTARKLDIDCAPALVGFDYHKGSCHPVNEGYVICEEFKDILLDAWNQDQAEQVKREEEKKLKQIYDNWRRLIRGMILKKRIKETYGNVSKQNESDCVTKEDIKKTIVKTVNSEGKMEIGKQNLATNIPKLIIHPIINLKIDYNSCISSMAKQKRQTNKDAPRKRKVLNEQGIKDSINCKQIKSSKELDLSDESDDSTDFSKKQEKIRKILEWNPDKDVERSNPNLSDNSDKEISDLETLRSLLCNTPTNNKCKIRKRKKIKIKSSDSDKERQTSTSEEPSSASDSEETTVSPAKRLSLRTQGKNKISYNERDAVASDISMDDSDVEDKTFVLTKKKPLKSLLDLSDESS